MEQAGAPLQIAVSLNGVDFTETGFTFSYYQKPEIVDISPRSGSVDGGTEIWLKGSKFSNITHSLKSVRCRFRQLADPEKNQTWEDENAPTKYIPAYYIDKETMKCASPSGWNGGDTVKVDLTFNGYDYTEASFDFNFYNIFGSFPKSGPADATTQYIQVRGKGFRKSDQDIKCFLDGQTVEPLSVHPNVIKCPMVLQGWPSDKHTSVPFAV